MLRAPPLSPRSARTHDRPYLDAPVYYIYDGEHVFIEGSDCCWEAEMTYYPGTDRPHSIRRGGQMFYYQTDALGSVTGLVNSSNQLVNRYQYTPWGEMETGESTYTTYDPLGFTARERDDETRLYYYRALLRPAAGALHQRRSDRAGGRAERVRVRGQQPDQRHGSEWAVHDQELPH